MSLRRTLALLALLLAFACQSFVTQTHVHAPFKAALGATIAGAGGEWQQIGRQSAPDQPADCPICREYAYAGHYLTPASVGIAPLSAIVVWLSLPLFAAWRVVGRSHAWLSRGPPTPSHA